MRKLVLSFAVVSFLTACGVSSTGLSCVSDDIYDGQKYPKFGLILNERFSSISVKSDVFEDWTDCSKFEMVIVCTRKTDLQNLTLHRVTGETRLTNYTRMGKTAVVLKGICKETNLL